MFVILNVYAIWSEVLSVFWMGMHHFQLILSKTALWIFL